MVRGFNSQFGGVEEERAKPIKELIQVWGGTTRTKGKEKKAMGVHVIFLLGKWGGPKAVRKKGRFKRFFETSEGEKEEGRIRTANMPDAVDMGEKTPKGGEFDSFKGGSTN